MDMKKVKGLDLRSNHITLFLAPKMERGNPLLTYTIANTLNQKGRMGGKIE